MLRSPHWMRWLSGDVRSLWIPGIPGAGKTILCSFLVQQIRTHCKNGQGSGYAYYYCYFGHNQEEAAPFLRWVIAQLCRQVEVVPNNLYDLFKRGGQPSMTELLLVLEEILQSFDSAYVLLDAADESKPRTDLLKVLRDLATDVRFANLRCLVTSRDYIDIEETLRPISAVLPMSNPFAAEDIRKHVQSVLHSNARFLRFPADLCQEIEDTLVGESKGM